MEMQNSLSADLLIASNSWCSNCSEFKGLILFQQDIIGRILYRFKMSDVCVQSMPMDSKLQFSKLMDESPKYDGNYIDKLLAAYNTL